MGAGVRLVLLGAIPLSSSSCCSLISFEFPLLALRCCCRLPAGWLAEDEGKAEVEASGWCWCWCWDRLTADLVSRVTMVHALVLLSLQVLSRGMVVCAVRSSSLSFDC